MPLGLSQPDRTPGTVPCSMNISLLCWNIEGLSSRLCEPNFVQHVLTFDVCCFVETFTSAEFDFDIYFSDYFVFHSPAVKLSHQGRRSGGVVTIVKKSFSNTVCQLPCIHDNMIALKFGSTSQGEVILVSVYIPPVDSQYYKDKEIKCNLILLEEALLDIQEAHPRANIVICGDLNARTSNWNQHIEDDCYSQEYDCHCPDNVSYRNSQDKVRNKFGDILIDLCKVYHICIMNGSNKDDREGKFTYVSQHGESVVDYCLIINTNFETDVSVTVGSRIDSSHMPLEIKVGSKTTKGTQVKTVKEISRIMWDADKTEEVLQNMQSSEFNNLLGQAYASLEVSLNSSVKILTVALSQAANCMRRTFLSSNKTAHKQAEWYDNDCKSAKVMARRALAAYKRTLATTDRSFFVQCRNNYKQLIRRKKKDYEKNLGTYLLKNLYNSDKFWHVIRKKSWKRAKLADIEIETWKSYFESLFHQNIVHITNLTADSEGIADIYDDALDATITTDEVDHALTKLSHGRAPGLDEIPSELVKLGRKHLVPFLTRLFNTIYDKKTYPEEWSRSIVVPIHKGGNSLDPSNYRGISLLSVISKLFSAVLTNRLQNWVEDNDKVCVEQAGFRREHSTVDHIFTLHAMITKLVYGGGRGKLYVAFVDYQKAFDTVNRQSLWMVLAKLGISTKLIEMLKAMYDKVQACVRWNGSMSDFFDCPAGTKQGALESPILFSLLITFVVNFVRKHGRHGVQMEKGQREIFFLIYADDIALLSTTPVGLQTQINSLTSASQKVGLRINTEKTKVMVFRRGGFLGRGEKWFLQGTQLEVVNSFKYLGYTFTTKLSENVALDNAATKAKQKIVSLLKMMWALHNRKPGIFFKLFDAQVQPSLLYASELWGLKEQASVERAHLFACKRFLNVHPKTPNNLVYGETGRFPLIVNSTIRAIKYWFRLQKMPEDRLPRQALTMFEGTSIPDKINWLKFVRDCLCKSGFAFVWLNRGVGNEKSFLKKLKVRLKDCFIQNWHSKINESQRFMLYSVHKDSLDCEKYLSTLEIGKFRDAFVRFRLGVSGLRTHQAFGGDDTHCPFCINQVEDEAHFLLECSIYQDLREKYIERYIQYINSRSFIFLIDGRGYIKTKNTAMFIHYALKRRLQRLLEME